MSMAHKETTRRVTLMTETDTIAEAFAFVMDAMDEVGEEPSIEINPRWSHDDGKKEHTYFAVTVSASKLIPRQEKSNVLSD